MSISPVVRRAASFQDLLAIQGGDGPYVFTRMFRESDRGERRQSRRHFRLLKHVDGAVREVVQADEKVLYLTEALGLSFWERWVLGWRRAVVLTDSRAILLQLDAGRRPRPHHRQMAYGAIDAVKQNGSSKVAVEMRGGDSVELRGLRRLDRTFVAEGLRIGAKAKRGEGGASGIERLCPHCHEALSGRPRSCPRCLGGFKRGWLSAFSSLLIPGLGNYLTGYRGFAVLEMLAAGAVWAACLLGPGVWGLAGLRSAVNLGLIFATVHGADAVLTWHVARSGISPRRD